MRILLDTNVVLDVALERDPFYQAALRILNASDFEKTHLFITASSATDLFYVLRKEKGREVGLKFIRSLLECVDACNVDERILIDALESDFLDFEDAVQNTAAIAADIEAIVTRDKSGYKNSPLTVFTPNEFAAAHLA
jgi:predicted nucleic acid-binding protein